MSISLTYVQEALAGTVERVKPLVSRKTATYQKYEEAYRLVEAEGVRDETAREAREEFVEMYIRHFMDEEPGELTREDVDIYSTLLFGEKHDMSDLEEFAEGVGGMENPYDV